MLINSESQNDVQRMALWIVADCTLLSCYLQESWSELQLYFIF